MIKLFVSYPETEISTSEALAHTKLSNFIIHILSYRIFVLLK